MSSRLLIFLLLLLSFPATGYSSKGQLRILITGDTKGILASEYASRNQGWLYLADALSPEPGEVPTLRLDAGDLLGGSDFSYFLTQEHSPPRFPQLEILNALHWDTVVLGNTDLALGADMLRVAQKTANFPMLAGNVESTRNTWPKFPSFEIIEKGSFSIGVFGLTTPAAPMWHEKLANDLAFLDILQRAKEITQILREEQQVDFIIALLHSGSNKRFGEQENLYAGLPNANAAGWVADHVSGIDLVVSGHAHQTFPRRPTSHLNRYRTPLVAPGAFGNGWIEVHWALESRQQRWRITQSHYQYVEAPQEIAEDWLPWLPWQKKADQFMTTALPIRGLKEPSKTAWSNCTIKLTKVALPEPRRALLPSWQYEPRLFPNTGEVLKRSHLHRWWPYRNHLQLASLHRPQLNILIDQKKWALIGNRLVEPSNQDVWMLNYHLQGNDGVYRALIDQDQIGQLDSISWPERLFQFLETTKTLPADCDFLKIIP